MNFWQESQDFLKQSMHQFREKNGIFSKDILGKIPKRISRRISEGLRKIPYESLKKNLKE